MKFKTEDSTQFYETAFAWNTANIFKIQFVLRQHQTKLVVSPSVLAVIRMNSFPFQSYLQTINHLQR